jgi:hypothetical protein
MRLLSSSLFALFACTGSLFAQSSAEDKTNYRWAFDAARDQDAWLVAYVGVDARTIDGTRGVALDSFNADPTPRIVYARPGQDGLAVAADATTRQLCELMGLPAPLNDGDDALDEVNAIRARRGLRPYLRDEGLTQAARSAAAFRAARRMAGHTPNDFGYLPPGANATATGCAAWPQHMGFGACCVFENWTHAGAAWTIGADGLRYCHLYIR